MHTFNKKLIITSAILASLTSSALIQAAPFGLEARSLGMGNVSVATADIATAALSNPAMLSYQESEEDFSLLLSGGVLIDDSDDIIDTVDTFQKSVTDLNAAQALSGTGATAADEINIANTQINAVNNMSNSGNALNGKSLIPSATLAAVVGFSFEEYSLAFSARNNVTIAGGLTAVNFGTGSIATLTPTGNAVTDAAAAATAQAAVTALDTTIRNSGNNILVLNGASVLELGLSGAKSFTFMNRKVSIGLTPKIVSADVFSSATPLANFNTGASDLIDTSNITSAGNTFTVDVGVVAEISESTQVGLVIKNLIEDKLTSGTDVVNIARALKIGAAYRGDFFTIGADLDLIEVDPVITSLNFQSKATQMASVGFELNAWDVAQVRGGMQKNIANNASPASEDVMYTAGVGFWIGVNVDVAVIANANTFGGFVQTGFKF